MQVHYKPSTLERIYDESKLARRHGKEIDYIELSRGEWVQMVSEVRSNFPTWNPADDPCCPFAWGGAAEVYGVRVIRGG